MYDSDVMFPIFKRGGGVDVNNICLVSNDFLVTS
jgi:hypothetical protein